MTANNKYELIGHSFTGKVGGFLYCEHCGLIALQNDFTRWAIKVGCLSHLHPSYNNQRSKTNPFGAK